MAALYFESNKKEVEFLPELDAVSLLLLHHFCEEHFTMGSYGKGKHRIITEMICPKYPFLTEQRMNDACCCLQFNGFLRLTYFDHAETSESRSKWVVTARGEVKYHNSRKPDYHELELTCCTSNRSRTEEANGVKVEGEGKGMTVEVKSEVFASPCPSRKKRPVPSTPSSRKKWPINPAHVVVKTELLDTPSPSPLAGNKRSRKKTLLRSKAKFLMDLKAENDESSDESDEVYISPDLVVDVSDDNVDDYIAVVDVSDDDVDDYIGVQSCSETDEY